MMKTGLHKIGSWFFILMLLCGMILIFSPDSVKAVGPLTYENWDSYNVGDTSGSTIYGSWECDEKNKFEVSNSWSYSGTNSLRNLKPTDTTTDYAWYNITSPYDYVGEVTLYGRFICHVGIDDDNVWHYIWLKNTSLEVNKIYFYGGISGSDVSCYLQIYDYDNTAYTLWSYSTYGISITFDWKLVITYTTLNLFNISAYWNNNDTYIHGFDISSRNVNTHTTYDQLKFSCKGEYHHVSSSNTFHIDDIVFERNISGDTTINVYNESSPSTAIPDFSLLIYDSNNAIHYSEHNLDNPLVVNHSIYGLGRIYFQVNATGYSTRTYYADIRQGVNYNLTSFLPPSDTSNLYYIQTINKYGEVVSNAHLTISKQLNGTIHEMASGFTNAFGMYPIYLLGGDMYKINITATGYTSLIMQDLAADPDNYGITNPIIYTLGYTSYAYENIMDNLTFDIQPEIKDHVGPITFYYNMTSIHSELEWYRMNVYIFNYTTEVWDHLFMNMDTTTSGGSLTFTTNNTIGLYGLKCEFKREDWGQYTFAGEYENLFLYTIYNVSNDTIIDDVDTIDDLIDETIGHSPVYLQDQVVAWSSLGGSFVVMMVMFTFSPKLAGFAVMSVGAVLGFFKSPLGLISDNVISMTAVVVIFILGVIVVIVEGKRD